jgi:hypothetical protein
MSIMGIRAYARLRGVSQTAVQKAIKDQRLVVALTRDANGRPLIDSDKASIEWPKSQRELDVESKARLKAARESQARGDQIEMPGEPDDFDQEDGDPANLELDSEDATEGDDPGDGFAERKMEQSGLDLGRARANKEQYAAKMAQVKYEKELGLVVDAEEVRKKWLSVVAIARTKILGLPSKIRGRLPGLNSSDYVMIEKLTYECLQELSEEGKE